MMRFLLIAILLAGCQTPAPKTTLIEAIQACKSACAPRAMYRVDLDYAASCACEEPWEAKK